MPLGIRLCGAIAGRFGPKCGDKLMCVFIVGKLFFGFWFYFLVLFYLNPSLCHNNNNKNENNNSPLQPRPHAVRHTMYDAGCGGVGWKTALCHPSCTIPDWPHCGALSAAERELEVRMKPWMVYCTLQRPKLTKECLENAGYMSNLINSAVKHIFF